LSQLNRLGKPSLVITLTALERRTTDDAVKGFALLSPLREAA
jgi:hypothetical protein